MSDDSSERPQDGDDPNEPAGDDAASDWNGPGPTPDSGDEVAGDGDDPLDDALGVAEPSWGDDATAETDDTGEVAAPTLGVVPDLDLSEFDDLDGDDSGERPLDERAEAEVDQMLADYEQAAAADAAAVTSGPAVTIPPPSAAMPKWISEAEGYEEYVAMLATQPPEPDLDPDGEATAAPTDADPWAPATGDPGTGDPVAGEDDRETTVLAATASADDAWSTPTAALGATAAGAGLATSAAAAGDTAALPPTTVLPAAGGGGGSSPPPTPTPGAADGPPPSGPRFGARRAAVIAAVLLLVGGGIFALTRVLGDDDDQAAPGTTDLALETTVATSLPAETTRPNTTAPATTRAPSTTAAPTTLPATDPTTVAGAGETTTPEADDTVAGGVDETLADTTAASSAPDDTATSTAGTDTTDAPTTTGPYDLELPAECEMLGSAREGQSGDDVECLEQRLEQVTVGGVDFEVDAVFDEDTTAAVTAFQEANGLIVDGIAGAETGRALGIWRDDDAPTTTD